MELVNVAKEKDDFQSVFDTDTSFVWEMDKDKKNLSASKKICKVLNIEEEKYPALLSVWKESIFPEDLLLFLKFIDELENLKGKPQELRIVDGKGNIIWLEIFVNVVKDVKGQVVKFVGTAVNVSHRKLEEQKVLEKSYYDQLTSLPNRKMFYRHFREQALLDDKEMSVIVLDIDRFKVINELYGRESGDKVLEMVADKLQLLLGNQAFIARESEDEFLILLEDTSEKRTKLIAEKIISVFKRALNIDNQLFYLTISMGISLYPETAQDVLALYQQAEIAMYKVKENGKNNYHVFMTDDAASIERKRRIEFGLKEALARNELYLVYQPKVDLSTGKSYATEALIRWKHPLLGEVSPGEFIPIAEESGIISDIGYWVIYEAIGGADVFLDFFKQLNLVSFCNQSD